MNIPVTDVVVGDVIIRSDTDITVTAIDIVGVGIIRISGRITRGYGHSNKVHTWTHYTDAEVDVDRGEARYIFTKSGREVRVR